MTRTVLMAVDYVYSIYHERTTRDSLILDAIQARMTPKAAENYRLSLNR